MLLASLIVALILSLSLFCLSQVYSVGRQTGWNAVTGYFFSINLAAFIFLFGPWLYLSVYLKNVFAVAYVTLLASRYIQVRPVHQGVYKWRIFQVCFALPLLLFNILYFTGTAGTPAGTVDLKLPFHSGTCLVQQGGRGLPGNVFHSFGRRTFFAIDLVQLNRFGNRAKTVFSSKLTDYETFGATVYSPCAGIVRQIENSNPDNIPPSRKRGPTNTNMVLIETDTAWVFLCHFRQGSVLVKPGDKISPGTPLAQAGNSGFSLEPHLHIQAHAKTNDGRPWYKGRQLLITFSGREYRLFEQIHYMDNNR